MICAGYATHTPPHCAAIGSHNENIPMTFYKTPQLQFTLDEAKDFSTAAAKKLGIPADAIISWQFEKKSLDVRHKNPKFQATLNIEIQANTSLCAQLESQGCTSPKPAAALPEFPHRACPLRIAIVGAGPAGLFAAMTLAEAGCHVDIFERGKPVQQRTRDIAALMHQAKLNPESNICFGEGGAGTFSDGKLMTRTKSQYIPLILDRFIQFGAQAHIRYENHPHIGTDRLAPLLAQMREWLESKHVHYHFETRVEDFIIESGRCLGIIVNGDKLHYDATLLAIGHSADDTFECLHHHGIVMEPKPLAIGVRVEHPQALINEIQYGKYANHPLLPPAEYAVRFNHDTLPSVFSFCMCPGGHVVPSQTTENSRVVNGMSGSKRNGKYANAALVAQIGPESFEQGPLGGLRFIRKLEQRAARHCPPAFAPAQSMMDFLAKKTPTSAPKTTYAPGTHPANLHEILPKTQAEALHTALATFDRQMHGFITREANFIGIESRTSSPIRIVRDEHFRALGMEGLYPIGEGAGYAGGITSCALDGMHAALEIAY